MVTAIPFRVATVRSLYAYPTNSWILGRIIAAYSELDRKTVLTGQNQLAMGPRSDTG